MSFLIRDLNLSLSRSLRIHSLKAFKKAFFFILPPELFIFSIILVSIGSAARAACMRLDLMEAIKRRRDAHISVARKAQTENSLLKLKHTGPYIYVCVCVMFE
eukprot:505119_1